MHTTDGTQPVGEATPITEPVEDTWPDADAAAAAAQWPEEASGTAAPDPAGRRRRLSVLAMAAVAAVGIAAGAVAEVAITSGSGAPSPYSAGPAPVQGAGNGGVGADGSGHVVLAGPVTAVTPTSITIGPRGSTFTFAVTRATRFTGRVKAIGSVKVGDLVSVSGTLSGSTGTAALVSDPPSLPATP
jgi:Domain of unknown function (DUF5666)